MSKTLQFRRGSTTLINTLSGADGELFVDTSKATIVVMNGVVLGGSPLATETFVTSALARVATSATLGTVRIDTTSIVISSGTISVPVATTAVTGILRPDGTSVVVSSGVISVTRNFTTSFAVSGTVVMSSPFTFRNRLINGNFQYWQRGTTTSTTGTYLADRWIATNISQQNRSTDSPDARFPFSVEFGNTTATYPYVAQRLEPIEAANLVSSELTISFWAKNTSGNAAIYAEILYPQTTSVYTSTMINVAGTGFLANPPTVSSWSFYTYTWSSSQLTTAFAQGLELRIVRDNSNPSTTRVTGVQLESGGAATPFELLPLQQQLALCQRYYHQGGNGAPGIFNGVTTARYSVMLPVTMRTVPVTTAIAAPIIINPTIAEQQTGSQSTGFSITGFGASVSYSVAQIQLGGFTSGADGRATTLLNTALAFSAEL
jgi:hypothetical protein